jgi:hypothetical protein
LLLKRVVARSEREILDRLKSQNVGSNIVSEVARKLSDQFAETVSTLKGAWVSKNITSSNNLDEEAILSIVEQIADQGLDGYGVAEEVRALLISHGFSSEKIDNIISKAQLRAEAAITHKIEIPEGAFNAATMAFFLDLEIQRNLRYNSPFSTLMISFDKIVDIRTFTTISPTQDIDIQLTNQSLKLLKTMKRGLDVAGVYPAKNHCNPFIILPMTNMTGALFVKKRIEKDFPCHEFTVNGTTVHVEPVLTASEFNRNLTPDKNSFLKEIYRLHSQPKLQ